MNFIVIFLIFLGCSSFIFWINHIPDGPQHHDIKETFFQSIEKRFLWPGAANLEQLSKENFSHLITFISTPLSSPVVYYKINEEEIILAEGYGLPKSDYDFWSAGPKPNIYFLKYQLEFTLEDQIAFNQQPSAVKKDFLKELYKKLLELFDDQSKNSMKPGFFDGVINQDNISENLKRPVLIEVLKEKSSHECFIKLQPPISTSLGMISTIKAQRV